MSNINDFGMPFTSIAGDRQYGSADWREYYRMFAGSGVIGDIENELLVAPQGTPNKTVKINTGAILIQGVIRIVDEVINLSFADNTSGSTRVDRVVARLNLTNDVRKLDFAVVQGSPGGGAPDLTQTSSIYELSLAKVTLANGYSTITASEITDERLDETLCGYFRYRAKPAWYPGGYAPSDAWMYIMFKNLLSAAEIADIEGNSTLMGIINGSSLVNSVDLRLKQLEYNTYFITIEAYYDGHFNSYYADNLKGLMFDGFTTDEYIDTVNTDAFYNTSNRIVQNGYPSTDDVGPSSISITEIVGDGSVSNIANMYDYNEATYATWSASADDSGYNTWTIAFGAPFALNGVKFLASGDDDGYTDITSASYSVDGVTWETLSVPITGISNPSVATWSTLAFNKTVYAKYIKLRMYQNAPSSSSSWWYFHEVKGISPDLSAGTEYLSDIFPTEQVLTKARLYITVREFGSATAVPSVTCDGTNYESLTLVDSYTDPMEPNHTEKVYDVTFANSGNSLGLKVSFAPYGDQFAEVKRWGLIFE